MRCLILVLIFGFLVSCAGMVPTNDCSDQVLVCPEDSPAQDYRFPVTNSGEDYVFKKGTTLWLKIPKGTFNEDNNPTTEAQYQEALKQALEQRKGMEKAEPIGP